ncbi:YceI family protein [Dokdonia sp.]|uniref:YceI family protein n=1 Tax=Dokdonia sp. TaxID=2024995 RepID=UPI003265D1F5
MNKHILYIILCIFLYSCMGTYNTDAQKAIITEESRSSIKNLGDTITMYPTASSVYWKGTKMRGAGKHEGEVLIKNGYFITKNKQIIGGHFIIDMSTIGVTDIPEHELIPRKNLNDHLKSSDFFDVAHFPIAVFDIITIKKSTQNRLRVSGNLTLKGITKTIEFDALYTDHVFSTVFTIDRFQWNIAYKGDIINKTLVDKDLELTIRIITK